MNQWTSETQRSDGLYVNKLATEHWVIRHPNGEQIMRCPCCDMRLESLRVAKLIADALWPARG